MSRWMQFYFAIGEPYCANSDCGYLGLRGKMKLRGSSTVVHPVV
jgi:hypothetical protein